MCTVYTLRSNACTVPLQCTLAVRRGGKVEKCVHVPCTRVYSNCTVYTFSQSMRRKLRSVYFVHTTHGCTANIWTCIVFTIFIVHMCHIVMCTSTHIFYIHYTCVCVCKAYPVMYNIMCVHIILYCNHGFCT